MEIYVYPSNQQLNITKVDFVHFIVLNYLLSDAVQINSECMLIPLSQKKWRGFQLASSGR
jgi:hypothetical protein